MNFLAHCLLAAGASDDPERQDGLIAGGLLGDFVKGPVPAHWPETARLGVRLHRRIDAYSNQHAGIRQSCDRFPAELRRFAPIFVDVIADHLLSLDWKRHHHAPVAEFSQRCYALVEAHRHLLEGEHDQYLDWMQENDLLAGYAEPEVMLRGLRSITRRLRRSHLDDAVEAAVIGALPELSEDFERYFPDLVLHAREFVATVQSQ